MKHGFLLILMLATGLMVHGQVNFCPCISGTTEEPDGQIVYRADTRTPAELSATGFVAVGEDPAHPSDVINYSLYTHVLGGATGVGTYSSAYISTTSSRNVAILRLQEHFMNNGYVYVIRPSDNFIDVRATLQHFYPHGQEREYAAIRRIRWQQVVGWYHLNFGVLGNFQANPAYDCERYDNSADGGAGYEFAGFPNNHAAWNQEPWRRYTTCIVESTNAANSNNNNENDNNNASNNSYGSGLGGNNANKPTDEECLPIYTDSLLEVSLNTFFDFSTTNGGNRKLFIRNINYPELNIQMALFGIDEYFSLHAGQFIELNYSNGEYYFDNKLVEWINLDYNAPPGYDYHDNLMFSSYSDYANAITYKQATLYSEQILIRDFDDLSLAKYGQVRDHDGVNGGPENAIVEAWAVGKRQFIDVKAWESNNSFDPFKLEKIFILNEGYDILENKRVRLSSAFDDWIDFDHDCTQIQLDYEHPGVVKYNGSVLQQIDFSNTADLAYAGGDEFNFSWYGTSGTITYRPYNTSNSEPNLTLVDFNTGLYSGLIDDDGIYGGTEQLSIYVDVSEDGKNMYIKLRPMVQPAASKPLNINAVEDAQSVSVYPNPATDAVYLTAKKEYGNVKGTIHDLTGKVVQDFNTNFTNKSSRVTLKDLPPGMYIIRINTKDGVLAKTFVKIGKG